MRLFVALMALAPPCILLHFAAFEPLLVHLVLLVCFSKEMGRGDGATVGNGAAGTGGGPVIRDRNKQAVISEKLIFECVYVQPTHAADDDPRRASWGVCCQCLGPRRPRHLIKVPASYQYLDGPVRGCTPLGWNTSASITHHGACSSSRNCRQRKGGYSTNWPCRVT